MSCASTPASAGRPTRTTRQRWSAAFRHSLLVLAAWEDGELAGLIRAVGDGATIVFIQDILVAPERQRRGIGTALLRALLERFNGVRQIS